MDRTCQNACVAQNMQLWLVFALGLFLEDMYGIGFFKFFGVVLSLCICVQSNSKGFSDFRVRNLSLAEYGRREIEIAEQGSFPSLSLSRFGNYCLLFFLSFVIQKCEATS